MALISIILPVHNGAATHSGAIESCLGQSHHEIELIIVDDASTDSTPSILQEWSTRDDRIRLCQATPHSGVAAAFQLGLHQARGEWIARMDADDINHPQRLEKQLALFQSRPELDAVSCLVEICKRTPTGDLSPANEGYQRFATWLNSLTKPHSIAAQRFIDQPVVNPSMLVRRSAFDRLGSYRTDLDWAEDYDFWLRLLHVGGQIAKAPETLFTWTDHDTRLTRTHADYTHDAFTRCKAHFLAQLPQVQQRGVAVLGAGPIGKALAQALQTEQVHICHFYEVHPRRIGEVIHQTNVLPLDALAHCQSHGPIALGSVGQPGKRQFLLNLALERGYTEGLDFFSVA